MQKAQKETLSEVIAISSGVIVGINNFMACNTSFQFEPASTTDTDIAIAVAVKTTTNTKTDFHDSSS